MQQRANQRARSLKNQQSRVHKVLLLYSQEMWALFDFACEGKLLGTSRTFKKEYEDPIVRVSLQSFQAVKRHG